MASPHADHPTSTSPPPAWTLPPSVSTPTPTPTLRWAVYLPPGEPSPPQLALATATLPDPTARAAIAAFLRPADRARALASRLLQAAAPAVALPGVGWGEAVIERTAKGGKPYVAFNVGGAWWPQASAAWKAAAAPNFNFNVSHDGAWAVLASEAVALVGVDVAAPPWARARSGAGATARGAAQLRLDFGECLAPSEWAAVERAGRAAGAASAEAEDAAFRTHWALKEAYTKARGDGLGCEFGGVVFEGVVGAGGGGGGVAGWAAAPPSTPTRLPASPTLVSQPGWVFELHALDGPAGHIVAVARGPAAQAVDEGGVFGATLLEPGRAVGGEPATPPSTFTILAVRDLLPDGARAGYGQSVVVGGV